MALSPESVSKDVRPAPEELTRVEPVPGPTAVEALTDEVSPEDQDPPPPCRCWLKRVLLMRSPSPVH